MGAADKLRGNIDASEYKYVVLGLIFLKYISDIFEEKMEDLTTELSGLFEEGNKLEEEIRERLKVIGYDI